MEASTFHFINCFQIAKGDTIMAAKGERGVVMAGTEILITNVYGIKLPAIPVYRYEVAVYGYTDTGKRCELNRLTREE